MYKFKTNKETGKQEIIKTNMNVHSLVLDKTNFEKAFTLEYAKFEYLALYCKYSNGKATSFDVEKLGLLEKEFKFTFETLAKTNESHDLHFALRPLFILTLFAHGKLIQDIKESTNDNGEKEIHLVQKVIPLGENARELYSKCRVLIPQVDNGTLPLESAIQELKPLYNKAIDDFSINTEKVDGVCKKWTQSTKEKCTRQFVNGLVSRYKLTRENRLKKDSPLLNEISFNRHLAMFIVSDGVMVKDKKDDKKSHETFDSIVNNLK